MLQQFLFSLAPSLHLNVKSLFGVVTAELLLIFIGRWMWGFSIWISFLESQMVQFLSIYVWSYLLKRY